MANVWYPAGKRAFARGEVAWKFSGGTPIRVLAIDASRYAFSSAHASLSDVAAASRVASAPLSLIDPSSEGVIDAQDVSIPFPPDAPSVEALIVYADTGTELTSPLLLYIDDAAGLPSVTGCPQMNVAWSDGVHRIARL